MKWIASLLILFGLCAMQAQQQPEPASSLPVPTQFATAKTIFIAPAGIDASGAGDTIFADAYVTMATAIAGLHRYAIEAAPLKAELSVRISVRAFSPGATAGSARTFYFLRAEIYDTHSGMLLWTLEREIMPANRVVTFKKNLEMCASQVAADFTGLAEGRMPQKEK